MRPLSCLSLLLASCLLVSCGGTVSTEIVVVVVSDSFPLHDVVIETQSSRRTPGPQERPFSFVLQPFEGQLPRVAEVVVRGTTADDVDLTAAASAEFVVGESRRLVLHLDGQCAPMCEYGPLPTEPVARGRELDLDGGPAPVDAGPIEDVGIDVGDGGPPGDTGPPIDAGPPDRIVDVAVSDAHTCVRWGSGRVRCWGANGFGQLGDGTTTIRPAPGVLPRSITDASVIEVGSAFTCAIASNDVWCWGANTEGEIGNGMFSSVPSPTPERVLRGYERLFAMRTRVCATTEGQTDCWGKETLGLPLDSMACGGASCAPVPERITGLAGAVAIDGTSQFVCAAIAGSPVVCAGEDAWGQLGDGGGVGEREDVFGAVLVVPPSERIATAERTVCAVAAGFVYCWGANDAGQTAQPGSGHSVCTWAGRASDCLQTALMVEGLADIVAIAASHETFCAIDEIGAVYCWGDDEHGQVGDGGPPGAASCRRTDLDLAVPCVRTAVRVAGLTAVAIGGMGSHFCAVTTEGEVVCWGELGGADVEEPMRVLEALAE